jgi:hypothetical protein
MSRSVRYGFITSRRSRRVLDLLAHRLGSGDEATGDDLCERDRDRAGIRRLGEQCREVRRQRPAVAAEAREERRLGLAHDVTGHAHHHVVEAPVLEVVLDAGAAGPRHRAVDHVELAVVDAAGIVAEVVDLDLRAGGSQARVHRVGRAVRLGAHVVDDHAHLHAVGELALEQLRHPRADLPLAPAEHQDVDGGARSLDVGEDAREEARAGRPRLERRRRRPRERQRGIVRVRPGERLGRGLRAGRRHRVGRRRPGLPLLDPEHAAMRDVGAGGRHADDRGPAHGAIRTPR